jgi:hypothetical protein
MLPTHTHDEIWFDLCEHCGMALLDFGSQRPRLYVQLEQQLARWQQRVASRQTQVSS